MLTDSDAIYSEVLSAGTHIQAADIRGKQVLLADTTAHVALLYGADPDCERRLEGMVALNRGYHARRIHEQSRYIYLVERIGDPLLVQAYRHQTHDVAASFVIIEPQTWTAISKTDQLDSSLERDLRACTGPGQRVIRLTLKSADLISYVRVSAVRSYLWLVYSRIWIDGAGNLTVEAYAYGHFAQRSVNDAIIQWLSHHRSQNFIQLLWNA
ncbi:hypothetical protein [Rhodococcus sp. JT-3]|uniref:hypothetical protein n=1 Tax=Rhodococcus sp. JT-3 TaxID=1973213 RepID=UPI002D800F88|nr:hypothetical protein [Rhodococcus sp. JT-3]